MRKAEIDPHTRRDIMGDETSSIDDRYTMIEDEDLVDAVEHMDAFQRARRLCLIESENSAGMKAEIARLKQELAEMKSRYNFNSRGIREFARLPDSP